MRPRVCSLPSKRSRQVAEAAPSRCQLTKSVSWSGPVVELAAGLVDEDPIDPCSLQGVALEGLVLLQGADAGVANLVGGHGCTPSSRMTGKRPRLASLQMRGSWSSAVRQDGPVQLRSVGELPLLTQGWLGSSAPNPLLLTQGSDKTPRPKPSQGFFTSTYDRQRQTTAWADKVCREWPERGRGRRLWLLEPDPDASLVLLDGPVDYAAFARDWPLSHGPKHPTHVDWRQLYETVSSLPFDGVHMTAAGAAALDDSGERWAVGHSWEVESTLWLRWRLHLAADA